MTTIKVRGQDVRIGDDLWFLGTPKRITRIEPYVHPVVTRNAEWRTAYADGPDGMYKAAWGITLEYGHGWAANYEVTCLPGDDRKDSPPPADDYLDPFLAVAAGLWARYQAEAMPRGILWRPWVEALPPEDLPGPHPSGLTCFTGVRAA